VGQAERRDKKKGHKESKSAVGGRVGSQDRSEKEKQCVIKWGKSRKNYLPQM